jgi:spermidine synthase
METGKAKLWFTESLSLDKGYGFTVEAESVLNQEETGFQDLAVYQTKAFGKMLVLDGAIQCTEFDEYCYQEMISHPAMMVHPDPRRVLIIGGGDGGVVREVLKHDSVESVDLVEIDGRVIENARKFLPFMSQGLDDSRVNVHTVDGTKFVKERENYFDVVIVDSSDPIGPAVKLFEDEFFNDVFRAMGENGVFVNQCENMFFDQELIHRVGKRLHSIYPLVKYYYTLVPTYPGGLIGFYFASKAPNPLTPCEKRAEKLADKMRYYSADVHKAAFVLPAFMKNVCPEYGEKG